MVTIRQGIEETTLASTLITTANLGPLPGVLGPRFGRPHAADDSLTCGWEGDEVETEARKSFRRGGRHRDEVMALSFMLDTKPATGM